MDHAQKQVVSIAEVVCHMRGIYTEHNIFIHSIAKQRSHKLFCTLKNCPGVAYTGMCNAL